MSTLLRAAQEAAAEWEEHLDADPLCQAIEQIIARGDQSELASARTLAEWSALQAWRWRGRAELPEGLEARFAELATRCAQVRPPQRALRGWLRRLFAETPP